MIRIERSFKEEISRPSRFSVRDFFVLDLPEKEAPRVIELLSDSVIYNAYAEERGEFNHFCDVSYLPGVTDNLALTTKELLEMAGLKPKNLRVGKTYLYNGRINEIKDFIETSEMNPLIQECLEGKGSERFSSSYKENLLSAFEKRSALRSELMYEVLPDDVWTDSDRLFSLSEERHLALNLNEVNHLIHHYKKKETLNQRTKRGLPPSPTDVELEIIAQSWSEHCKHKIFAAEIDYTEDKEILGPKIKDQKVNSLYKSFIKKVTHELREEFSKKGNDWCLSVFSDNAGVVKFSPKHLSKHLKEKTHLTWAIKAETHNSPSALDPYGGALTGILGVNRDIMGCGLGFRPVANYDVFCLPPTKWPHHPKERELLPQGPIAPEKMLPGVHRGVQEGGNHSGIPTIAGAFHFDPCFAGKPLVFCGTLGVASEDLKSGEKSYSKKITPGHKIVVVGGAVGADGIHGATFSSRELDATSPTSAVQIGDPLMQKRVLDFLMEARDQGLYAGITDNGAGGLSSSIGEMAHVCEGEGGAWIDLSLCPTKYPGLKAYEIMISESQERMSLAVENEKLEALTHLAKRRNVPLAVLGEFTDSGLLEIRWKDQLIGSLSLEFLHESLPAMKLAAKWEEDNEWGQFMEAKDHWPPPESAKELLWSGDVADLLKDLGSFLQSFFRKDNLTSKEDWVRKYDHEVQGATALRPYQANLEKKTSSPRGGGGVLASQHALYEEYKQNEDYGVALSLGLRPKWSRLDPYVMAIEAVDETVRNLNLSACHLEEVALLDNFCWPDPVASPNNPQGELRLGQLVRTCQGLYDICKLYKMPLVSGKDSMKNDFKGKNFRGDQLHLPIDPTLLVSGIASFNPRITPSQTFSGPDLEIYWVRSDFSLQGSEFFDFLGKEKTETFCKAYLKKTYQDDLFEWRKSWGEKREEKLKNFFLTHQKISELLQSEKIEAIQDVSEGGVITALCEMSFASQLGVNLESKGRWWELFSEGPGQYLIAINKEEKESLFKTIPQDYLEYLGRTQSDYFLNWQDERINLGLVYESYQRGLEG